MSESPENKNFKNLQPEQIVAACLMAGFAFFTAWDQVHWWSHREEYSFGYLVPLFVTYVVYDRWPEMRRLLFMRAIPQDSRAGLGERTGVVRVIEAVAFVAFGVSLLLFGLGAVLRAATGPQNPASLAIAAGLAGFVLSGVFIFAKQRVDGACMPLKHRLALVALFVFPALIWFISAPLVSVLETQIRVFLLNKVTVIVFFLLDFLGFEIERQGNVLILPEGQVGVEEACSGIRSLTACLFSGSFLAAVFISRLWKKVLLVAAAMGFAVLTNLIRSMFLTLWAYRNGSGSIDEHWVLPLIGDIGSVHDVTGMAILLVTSIGLVCLLPIINYQLPVFDHEEDEP